MVSNIEGAEKKRIDSFKAKGAEGVLGVQPKEEKKKKNKRVTPEGVKAHTFYITPEQYTELGILKAKKGEDLSTMVRDAIDWYVLIAHELKDLSGIELCITVEEALEILFLGDDPVYKKVRDDLKD